jgi:hypothetical protein
MEPNEFHELSPVEDEDMALPDKRRGAPHQQIREQQLLFNTKRTMIKNRRQCFFWCFVSASFLFLCLFCFSFSFFNVLRQCVALFFALLATNCRNKERFEVPAPPPSAFLPYLLNVACVI